MYCVRVTVRSEGRILSPVNFIYDCLSVGKFDETTAVSVEMKVVDGDIELYINYGETFGQFMVARG
jgi:hypothetical protein